ncbi:MAG TPA: hypothetical protein VF458_24175 [Ktedonobacteraceae bacterium]
MAKQAKDMLQETAVKQERWSTRQPASRLSKLAFWLYLVGTIAGVGGSVAITIGAGAPSFDIILATATSLVCTVLVATRIRWLQVLSLVIGLYLLYQIYTQPYVLSSLMAPKTDPQGGFGHFIGVVLLAMCETLAVCANLGVVLQNRRGSRQTPNWFASVRGGIIGMALGVLLLGTIIQPAVSAGTQYTNGVPTVHMSAGGFVQTSVTISKGSKLLLVDDVAAVHILANGTWQNSRPVQTSEPGAPNINNIQISSGSIEVGPFTTAGTYHIYCKVHVGMNLTVIVQ